MAATAIPTAIGMMSANPTHTTRMIHEKDPVRDRHERDQQGRELRCHDTEEKNRPRHGGAHHDREEGLLAGGGLPEEGSDGPSEEGVQDFADRLGDEPEDGLEDKHEAVKIGLRFMDG